MNRLQQRLYFFAIISTGVLLFNIFSYLYLQRKHRQLRLQEDALVMLSKYDGLSDEVLQYLLVLNIHNNFSSGYYNSKLEEMHERAHQIDSLEVKLSTNFTNEKVKGVYHSFQLPLLFSQMATMNRAIHEEVHLLSGKEKPVNEKDAAVRATLIRKLGIDISRNNSTMTQALFQVEKKIEKEGKIVVYTSLAFLALSWIGSIFLLLLPFIRQTYKSQKLAKENEKKYQYLFNNVPIAMWIYDPDNFRFLEVNDKAIQQYGYTREEFSAISIFDIRNEDEKIRLQKLVDDRSLTETVRPRGNWVHRTKDGTEITVDIISHVIDYNGRKAILVLANDITRQLSLQHSLIEEKVNKQKEISKAIINTQEKERSDIGKELHDNVNQILTTVKLYIENIRIYPDIRDQFINKGIELVNKAIGEIRSLSHQLVTPVLQDIGLRETLGEMVDHYRAMQLFKLELTMDDIVDGIEKDMQLTIYRIVQEQLNNIVKHASATSVNIAIERKGKALQLLIEDDGNGFNMGNIHHGMGLNNIQNRIAVFHGTMELHSSPGKGCRLSVTLPLSELSVSPEEVPQQEGV